MTILEGCERRDKVHTVGESTTKEFPRWRFVLRTVQIARVRSRGPRRGHDDDGPGQEGMPLHHQGHHLCFRRGDSNYLSGMEETNPSD